MNSTLQVLACSIAAIDGSHSGHWIYGLSIRIRSPFVSSNDGDA